MPILAREPDCFPPDLFERFEGSERRSLRPEDGGDGPTWWLTYSRSRREKDLARRLSADGVPFYCPMIARRVRSPAGRVRESWVPLFPGYVFLFGTTEDRRAALATNCVSSVGPVPDPDHLVRELRALRRLIATDAPITPEDRLEPGHPVRVVTGPLRGQEGVVIERRGRRRLLVAVHVLQKGASADLDECDVERI